MCSNCGCNTLTQAAESISDLKLKKDSCCCGATKKTPCICMILGSQCSSVKPMCPCYRLLSVQTKDEKSAEEFWKGIDSPSKIARMQRNYEKLSHSLYDPTMEYNEIVESKLEKFPSTVDYYGIEFTGGDSAIHTTKNKNMTPSFNAEYVGQLTSSQQREIESRLRDALSYLPPEDFEDALENGMDSKIKDLADTIDIEEFFAESAEDRVWKDRFQLAELVKTWDAAYLNEMCRQPTTVKVNGRTYNARAEKYDGHYAINFVNDDTYSINSVIYIEYDADKRKVNTCGVNYQGSFDWDAETMSEDMKSLIFEKIACNSCGTTLKERDYFYEFPEAVQKELGMKTPYICFYHDSPECLIDGFLGNVESIHREDFDAETFEARDDSWCVNHGWIHTARAGDIIPCTSCNDMICEGCRCGGCGNCENSDCCECKNAETFEAKGKGKSVLEIFSDNNAVLEAFWGGKDEWERSYGHGEVESFMMEFSPDMKSCELVLLRNLGKHGNAIEKEGFFLCGVVNFKRKDIWSWVQKGLYENPMWEEMQKLKDEEDSPLFKTMLKTYEKKLEEIGFENPRMDSYNEEGAFEMKFDSYTPVYCTSHDWGESYVKDISNDGVTFQQECSFCGITRRGYSDVKLDWDMEAESFEASVVAKKLPTTPVQKAMLNRAMMEQAEIEHTILDLETKARLGLLDERALMQSLAKKFGAEGAEEIAAYYQDFKEKHPELHETFVLRVANEDSWWGEYRRDKSYQDVQAETAQMLADLGYDFDMIDDYWEAIGYDMNPIYETCPDCEGEGIIITRYYPATRDDPADADYVTCEMCDGEGKVLDNPLFDAETKKRGFRKCSKCGYSDHNSSNCNRLDEYEAYRKHKDEMLKECDDAIQSFTKKAKRYSEDGEYGLAKMLRSDATDMKKLKRMIENNHFGKAVHFAMTMDSDPRELAPSALWMFDAESFEAYNPPLKEITASCDNCGKEFPANVGRGTGQTDSRIYFGNGKEIGFISRNRFNGEPILSCEDCWESMTFYEWNPPTSLFDSENEEGSKAFMVAGIAVLSALSFGIYRRFRK